jgi:chemotaxis methyl-accepting protein methylase
MQEAVFHEILAILSRHTGTDFSLYRHATLRRRIQNRMMSVGASSAEHYLALLRGHDAEVPRLLERVTIKVSRFYRNAEVFKYLGGRVLPRLAASRGSVDVWCAGCAYGEEAYSLALLLEEARLAGVVYASDVDEGALERARDGLYAADAMAELPAALAQRHFDPVRLGRGRAGYRVRPSVRNRVQFCRHDMTSAEPPRPRAFDLISCRNVLIYFSRTMQERAFGNIRAALADGGYVCLGEAEWPPSVMDRALAVSSRKMRVFRASCGRPGGTAS